MLRRADESGVSGTGRVLDGVVFHTGQVIVCWRGDVNAERRGEQGFSSIALYPCWEAFTRIHVDSHPGNKTEIIFQDGAGTLAELARVSDVLDQNLEE